MSMNTIELNNLAQNSSKMPIMFVGHGNPMNAIIDNIYKKEWKRIGKSLEKPKAILCISAHWLSRATYFTTSEHPKTIHDFGGFPEELFRQSYSAPGAKTIAETIINNNSQLGFRSDPTRGLDHGTWTILMSMFPNADIPVFQMSIDFTKSIHQLYEIGKALAYLRNKGILIIGSGNIVHNLQFADFSDSASPYDWAVEFDSFIGKNIASNNFDAILNYNQLGNLAQLAHPTNEHLLPLIFILAMKRDNDSLLFFNKSIDLGSMGMRSLLFY